MRLRPARCQGFGEVRVIGGDARDGRGRMGGDGSGKWKMATHDGNTANTLCRRRLW